MNRLLIMCLSLALMGSINAQDANATVAKDDGDLKYDSLGVAALTHNLIVNANTDEKKLSAIYEYVITTISYDTAAYQNGIRRINKNNIDVLRRKKAVCWGYSELIREMCSYAGIESHSISGYGKDLQVPSRSFEKANHAWNVVRLNGEWFLLDATWASGIASGGDYFKSVYGVDYFLTPPRLFIKTHFPLLSMWQLLSCPLSLEEFYADSEVGQESCSFDYNMQIDKFLALSQLEQKAQSITVAYRMNRSIQNRVLLGHALVDIAIEKKEVGERYFEVDQEQYAIEQLEASIDLFEIAKEYCDFFPWQEHAYLFTSINLVQAYYSLYKSDIDRYPFILSQLEETQGLFENSGVDNKVKNHVFKQIHDYQEVLETALNSP